VRVSYLNECGRLNGKPVGADCAGTGEDGKEGRGREKECCEHFWGIFFLGHRHGRRKERRGNGAKKGQETKGKRININIRKGRLVSFAGRGENDRTDYLASPLEAFQYDFCAGLSYMM